MQKGRRGGAGDNPVSADNRANLHLTMATAVSNWVSLWSQRQQFCQVAHRANSCSREWAEINVLAIFSIREARVSVIGLLVVVEIEGPGCKRDLERVRQRRTTARRCYDGNEVTMRADANIDLSVITNILVDLTQKGLRSSEAYRTAATNSIHGSANQSSSSSGFRVSMNHGARISKALWLPQTVTMHVKLKISTSFETAVYF
ncbi:hypothetical protein RRG08_051879 [Elysia crispata]|uniref:Uncharacterized protein n=1 Tax=Elysia crispata TaxID=231223 RepID=A0AAE1DCD8_9GAST|nr:hypothetical protein RRG08_051879 [Elysia crispata]